MGAQNKICDALEDIKDFSKLFELLCATKSCPLEWQMISTFSMFASLVKTILQLMISKLNFSIFQH